jgi:AcrR family transcriptional regulator
MKSVGPAELRADAARNREALLEAATRIFATSATEPSMRAIAREAGVGIATLYRHFPTREALVEAVYRDQVQRLTQEAGELLRRLPPSKALRAWMDLFGDWLMTKHGMIDTLRSLIDSGEIAHTETRDELLAAVTSILDAGSAAGDLRSDVAVDDIAASLIGIYTVTAGQSERTGRLLDLLVDGLRPQSCHAAPDERRRRPAGDHRARPTRPRRPI